MAARACPLALALALALAHGAVYEVVCKPGQPYGLTPQHMVFQSQQQHQYPAGYLFNGSA
eukprot:1548143-Rhodomonas_salina.1